MVATKALFVTVCASSTAVSSDPETTLWPKKAALNMLALKFATFALPVSLIVPRATVSGYSYRPNNSFRLAVMSRSTPCRAAKITGC